MNKLTGVINNDSLMSDQWKEKNGSTHTFPSVQISYSENLEKKCGMIEIASEWLADEGDFVQSGNSALISLKYWRNQKPEWHCLVCIFGNWFS